VSKLRVVNINIKDGGGMCWHIVLQRGAKASLQPLPSTRV